MLSRIFRIRYFRVGASVAAVTILLHACSCSDEHGDLKPSPVYPAPQIATAQVIDYVTIEFEGSVTAINDPNGVLGTGVGVGDPVAGFFVYDESASDEHAKPDVGRYRFQSVPCGVGARAEDLVFASDPAAIDMTIKLLNDKKTKVVKDQYEVSSANNLDVLPGVSVASISLLLVDETATALSSDSLAGQKPDTVLWPTARELTISGADNWTVAAQISRIGIIYPVSRPGPKEQMHRD